MSEIKIKYGRGQIAYDERKDQWYVYIDNVLVAHRSKLSDAKKAIDQHGDEEKKLERHTAILKNYREGFVTVEVTSYPEESSWGGPKAWVTRTEGNRKTRSQESISDLYEDSPKNHVIISQLKAIEAEIEALHKKRDALQVKLEKYTQRKIQ
jgi:hypothetical protein